MPNLANDLGDPQAFISPSGGRGQIKAVCQQRGLACEGAVKVKGRAPSDKPGVRLADDIVDRKVSAMVARDPSLKKVNQRDLRERVIAKHGAKA